MDQQLQSMYGVSSDLLAVRHRVLRNTYWLLALSMIPTVIGAWLGLQIHFSLFAGSPMISFIAFLAIAFGFFLGQWRGISVGEEYFATWVTQYPLSIDNLFVFIIIQIGRSHV